MLLTAPTSRPLTSQGSYNITELFSGFHPSSLDPHLLFDPRQSMGSSGFLDSVATLSNLSEGPNAGGDATQTTALSQPKALPLTADSNGVLGGYCYLPDVTGNAPSVTFPTIDSTEDFVFEMEVYLVDATSFHLVSGVNVNNRLAVYNGNFYFSLENAALSSPLSTGASTLTVERSGTTATLKQDGVVKATLGANIADNAYTFSHLSFNGQYGTGIQPLNGYIKTATLSIEGTEILDVDFNANHIPHGATKFQCDSGQVVTINQSGNDPATVIKKPVLRFDGANDGLKGLLDQTVAEFHYFIAFSILGNGGQTSGRIFEMSSDDGASSQPTGIITGIGNGTDLAYYANSLWQVAHDGMFDDANGDLLHQLKITNGSQVSKINNADEDTRSLSTIISAEEFAIGMRENFSKHAAIDLEYLGLFAATLTDAQAADVVNYINNRNTVFDLIDSQGHYFFDGTKAPDGTITPSATWNGRIVGSDNGDADLIADQDTSTAQPIGDGYKVTFSSSAEFLQIPSTSQAGYQIVGTSLGTFAYKVDSDAVTELNLLGNLGSASNRKTGDLYGIILLPNTATGKDIADARQKLIDRGAADGTTTSDYFNAWFERNDITEFRDVDFTGATNLSLGWKNCASLTSFNVNELPSATNVSQAWRNTALTSFSAALPVATDASAAWRDTDLTSFSTALPAATYVSTAWRDCSSLTSFSTALPVATNVSQAWRSCSSLTSFNVATLPAATNVSSGWSGCSSLTSFSTELPVATSVTNSWNACSSLTSFDVATLPAATSVNSAWRQTGLTSFSTELPAATTAGEAWYLCSSLASFNVTELPAVTNLSSAWKSCGSLTSFSTELPVVTNAVGCWNGCTSLADFSADVFANWNPTSISSGIFNNAWASCFSLTAQSVESILTSIDSSGKYATSTGLSGGTALADPVIDIDYDVSTGSLTAATLSAIESLNGRGWSVNINNEIIVPNILQLEPAAAYSLRSFQTGADPNVVNVRRSSDSALRDFTASEVSDGTLTSWVGAGNNGHVTTWYDQGGSNHATQTTASSQLKIVDNGVLVTSNGNPALLSDSAFMRLELGNDDVNQQATLDSYYVTDTTDTQYIYPTTTSNSVYGMTAQDGSASTTTSTGYGSPTYYANGVVLSNFRNSIHDGASGGQRLVVHQGANTFNSNWANMRWGTYSSIASTFDFGAGSAGQTGKLQEMIFFNTDQSANRTGIETNINDHFDIYS